MNQDSEKRRFSRILFDAPAVLSVDDTDYDTLLVDVSLKGALLRAPADWSIGTGTQARLRIRLDGGDDHIDMEGALAHQENGRIGFACRKIDMDSITHLRRLVELNLGQPELLERELAQLG